MPITTAQLQAICTGDESQRVETLRMLLNYPLLERDSQGSRFWYLRPGNNEDDAAETCPIAVGFYQELNQSSDKEIKQFLTDEPQQNEIYGHYINRIAENQPVMYLLLPSFPPYEAKKSPSSPPFEGGLGGIKTQQQSPPKSGELGGRVAFILPTEGQLRQRGIQTFSINDEDFRARLSRLHQEQLGDKILENLLNLVPQVDYIFYKPAHTAQELAQELAVVTQRIERAIPDVYDLETEAGYLHKLLESFQKELLPNLKLNSTNQKDYSFSDIYAQTIAYGLFTARVFSYVKNPKKDFNRDHAWEQLPETNPFLKQLFEDISKRPASQLGDELIDSIDEALGILRAAKMEAILTDFRNNMNREDIVIRFYEDFLAAYKPQMRERRGVYYTPEPVVSYMVRSVDELIKDKFNKPLGIADPEVMILDPACGTGTFLLWIFQLIYQRFQEHPDLFTKGLTDKSWNGYVSECLLPRIFGFELLVAPYAICHLKLGLFLEETGYKFDSGKRLGVYLINTLEDIQLREEKQQLSLALPQMEELIAEEAKAGSRIKKNEPIMVIIGNPPYSYDSSNNEKWISDLVRDYYKVDGKDLGERNPKGLQDDYVKFIRFAQWRIDETNQGILAFINNHGFLDNPTFRGMRQQLINSFDGISIYDLHGNTKKKETCPDGSKDENVFDIQQGVSISLAVKGKDKYINHAHLYGLREYKYQVLAENTINTTEFKAISPQSEFYLLIPQDNDLSSEYKECFKITDIMNINSVGILTSKDSLTTQFTIEDLKNIYQILTNQNRETIYELLDIEDSNSWKLSNVIADIKNVNINDAKKILYRTFDTRYTYYTGKSDGFHGRPRYEVMQHMINENNLGLITVRQVAEGIFNHVLVTNTLVDCRITLSNKGYGTLFPLYLYPDTDKPEELQEQKRPNFSPEFLKTLETKLDYLPTPEAIFYYIYAIFHSPTYRSRYAEFLKIDFPRVPLTSNNQLFSQLSEYGQQLVQLHLMTSPLLDNPITEFISKGEHIVAPGHPKYSQQSVIINKQGDAFQGVPEAVWNFYIGGYQVCQKWLKDRKERTLSAGDILHYQKIVVAISETIKLMQLIDTAIPGFPIE